MSFQKGSNQFKCCEGTRLLLLLLLPKILPSTSTQTYLVLLLQTWSHLGECPLKILAFLELENKQRHSELFYIWGNAVTPEPPKLFWLASDFLLLNAQVVRIPADYRSWEQLADRNGSLLKACKEVIMPQNPEITRDTQSSRICQIPQSKVIPQSKCQQGKTVFENGISSRFLQFISWWPEASLLLVSVFVFFFLNPSQSQAASVGHTITCLKLQFS